MFRSKNIRLSLTNKIFILIMIPLIFVGVFSIQLLKINYSDTDSEYSSLVKGMTFNYLSYKIYDNYYLRNVLVAYSISRSPEAKMVIDRILNADNFLVKQYRDFDKNFYIAKAEQRNFKTNLAAMNNSNLLDKQLAESVVRDPNSIGDAVFKISLDKDRLFSKRDKVGYTPTSDKMRKNDSYQVLANLNLISSVFNYNLLEMIIFDVDVFNQVMPVLQLDRDSLYGFNNNIYNPNLTYIDFVKTRSANESIKHNSVLIRIDEYIKNLTFESQFKQLFMLTYANLFTFQGAVKYPDNIRMSADIGSAALNYIAPYIMLFKHIGDMLAKHSVYAAQTSIQQYIRNFNNTVDDGFFYLIFAAIVGLYTLLFGRSIAYIFSRLYRELKDADISLFDYTQRLNLAVDAGSIQKIADEQPYQLSYTRNKELLKLIEIFNSNLIKTRKTLRDQILLKVTIKTVFSNLIYKNQNLINKQVKIIDQMERGEKDNNKLQKLFLIDHITARLRRNIDNLSILSGNVVRVEDKPMHLFDIARLSLGEIEEYNRVEISSENSTLLASSKVIKSLSRILSELLDNALYFSSKEEKVMINFVEQKDFVEITVVDNGIGMKESELSEYNKRLSQVHDIDINVIDHTGFYVVSKLGSLHSINISLASRKPRGLIAKVLLPKKHIVDSGWQSDKKDTLSNSDVMWNDAAYKPISQKDKEILGSGLRSSVKADTLTAQVEEKRDEEDISYTSTGIDNLEQDPNLYQTPVINPLLGIEERFKIGGVSKDIDRKLAPDPDKPEIRQEKTSKIVDQQNIPIDPKFKLEEVKDSKASDNIEHNFDQHAEEDILEKEDNTLIFNRLRDILLETANNEDAADNSASEEITGKSSPEAKFSKRIDSNDTVTEDNGRIKSTSSTQPNKNDKSDGMNSDNSGGETFRLPTRNPQSNLNKGLVDKKISGDYQEEQAEKTELSADSIKQNLFSIQKGIKEAREHVKRNKNEEGADKN